MRRIVVVGASLAGSAAARELRRLGFDGELTVVGDEPHRPYQRPPLSKDFLAGRIDESGLALHLAAKLGDELRLATTASALDLHQREVVLADGRRLPYDGLVIATGARPRRFPHTGQAAGVFTLRTVDDARALRAALATGPRVAVVGAGFIGMEVAATARELGCEVTVVDVLPAPFTVALGARVGRRVGELHRDRGVGFRLGVPVTALAGRGAGVTLADDTQVPADVVVVGIGVQPQTEWLARSGVPVDNGVRCDATCAVLGVPDVVAAGDVARWPHPAAGEVRVEHWDNAIAQGRAAARRLLHGSAAQAYAPVLSFWSEQFGVRYDFLGLARPDDDVRFEEDDGHRFVATYHRDGRLTAVLAADAGERLSGYRTALAAATTG